LFKLSLNSYAAKDTICVLFLTKKDLKYEKRLRKEGNMLGLPIKQNLCHFSVSLDAYHWPSVRSNGPTDPLHSLNSYAAKDMICVLFF
jgi:hypothetical protein